VTKFVPELVSEPSPVCAVYRHLDPRGPVRAIIGDDHWGPIPRSRRHVLYEETIGLPVRAQGDSTERREPRGGDHRLDVLGRCRPMIRLNGYEAIAQARYHDGRIAGCNRGP
jgi:hypothetical protein